MTTAPHRQVRGRAGGARLTTLLRAELFKIATNRGQRYALFLFWVLQAPMLVFLGADAAAEPTWDGLRSRSGLMLGYLLMALGALVSAQEFRWRTATLAWLVTPARRRVLVAQLLAVSVVGLAAATVTFTAWTAVGTVRVGGQAMRLDRPGDLAAQYVVVAATVCAAGAVGLAAGALTRSPSGALLGLCGIGLLELIGDSTRFYGPVTSPLGVLAWPTSELDPWSFGMALVWAGVWMAAAAILTRRDLPG
ncbi:MAG: ABC transporter permease [Frankia sp.]|nr:ABC transporter permease [Frankia sp.]